MNQKQKFVDFRISERLGEPPSGLAKRIICKLTLGRAKSNKPTVLLLAADSGEGKSYTALQLTTILLEQRGLKLEDYLNDVFVFLPKEYPEKIDALLHSKRLKKINVLVIDEAREVVKANLWHTFINQAISDVNAMSRGIKPIILIVNTQFIKDIDKKIRNTLTYYGVCHRPKDHPVQMVLHRIWKDDRDIENPRLKKRLIFGSYKTLDGENHVLFPRFIFKKPKPNICELYEKMQFDAKSKLIRRKLDSMLKLMEAEFKDKFEKVDAMVEFYSENVDALKLIADYKRKKIVLKKQFLEMHDLTREEKNYFQEKLNEAIQKKSDVVLQGEQVSNELLENPKKSFSDLEVSEVDANELREQANEE